MKTFFKWLVILFIIIPIAVVLLAMVYGTIFPDDTSLPKTEIKKEVKKPAPKIEKKVIAIPTLEYSVLPIKRVGLKAQNRAVQSMIVNSDSKQTEESLKHTAIKHWKDNSYNRYDELTIFIYLLGMDTNGTAYCVVEFDKKGKINNFSINEYFTDEIAEIDSNNILEKPNIKKEEDPKILEVFNSFDIEYKIEAFIDIINIEGKGMYESRQKYSDPKDWELEIDYQRSLISKYELKWYKKQKWWRKIKKDVKSANKIKQKIIVYMMERDWLEKFENDPRRIKYKGIDY